MKILQVGCAFMKKLSVIIRIVIAMICIAVISLLTPGPWAAAADTSNADAEEWVFNEKIPLDSDLQHYLCDLCAERSLDYRMALAIIRHESGFNADALGGGINYGLFQINKCNHKTLSAALKTANKPFDPETNINWGTYLLSDLFEKYAGNYTGDALTKAVLSAYNMGEGGFKKHGFAKTYIKGYYKDLETVNSWFA
jgi:soluble lytic murein transglycosylase-like protein